jgi:hypothetical protein
MHTGHYYWNSSCWVELVLQVQGGTSDLGESACTGNQLSMMLYGKISPNSTSEHFPIPCYFRGKIALSRFHLKIFKTNHIHLLNRSKIYFRLWKLPYFLKTFFICPVKWNFELWVVWGRRVMGLRSILFMINQSMATVTCSTYRSSQRDLHVSKVSRGQKTCTWQKLYFTPWLVNFKWFYVAVLVLETLCLTCMISRGPEACTCQVNSYVVSQLICSAKQS